MMGNWQQLVLHLTLSLMNKQHFYYFDAALLMHSILKYWLLGWFYYIPFWKIVAMQIVSQMAYCFVRWFYLRCMLILNSSQRYTVCNFMFCLGYMIYFHMYVFSMQTCFHLINIAYSYFRGTQNTILIIYS